jgi:hypothetical protein
MLKTQQVLSVFRVINYDERALERLDSLEGFKVNTQYDNLPQASFDFLDKTVFLTGNRVTAIDLDDVGREHDIKKNIKEGSYAKVEWYERDFIGELQDARDIVPIIVSDQPRNGLQVGEYCSDYGKKYLNFWRCFEERGIKIFASHTWGPIYTGYKHHEYAVKEVGNYITELGNVGAVSYYGDKLTDIVFANRLHKYLNNKIGLKDFWAYWIRKQKKKDGANS